MESLPGASWYCASPATLPLNGCAYRRTSMLSGSALAHSRAPMSANRRLHRTADAAGEAQQRWAGTGKGVRELLRYVGILVVMIPLASVSCGGQAAGPGNHASGSDHDRELQEKRTAWYQQQVRQDCPPGPYDQGAIEAVLRAHQGEGQFVYGPKDPPNRQVVALEHLKTRPNPRGEAVLVTGWEDANPGGSVDYSRKRSVWLVLDGKVYPVNHKASTDIGRLYDGMPEEVQRRAGLTHSYEPGHTMLDQLGIEESTFERRFSGGNPFPMCP